VLTTGASTFMLKLNFGLARIAFILSAPGQTCASRVCRASRLQIEQPVCPG